MQEIRQEDQQLRKDQQQLKQDVEELYVLYQNLGVNKNEPDQQNPS